MVSYDLGGQEEFICNVESAQLKMVEK